MSGAVSLTRSPEEALQIAQAELAELRAANASLQARLAQLTCPEEIWMPLKRACSMAGVSYERGRRWAAEGRIQARRDGGGSCRWLVNLANLRDRKELFR